MKQDELSDIFREGRTGFARSVLVEGEDVGVIEKGESRKSASLEGLKYKVHSCVIFSI